VNKFIFVETKPKNMKAIINRQQNFGTLNGVITKNDEIRKVVNNQLKQGTAKLLVDTEETLMYELGEQKPNSYYDTSATALCSFMAAQCEQKTFSPLHPIFEQALKSFMP
jgi:hypothetical protein